MEALIPVEVGEVFEANDEYRTLLRIESLLPDSDRPLYLASAVNGWEAPMEALERLGYSLHEILPAGPCRMQGP